MKTHQLIQGSQEWHEYRKQHFNASDAPAMMGCSAYETRNELIRRMHTGLSAEVDPATQRRFDDGHRFEALARPLAEEIIGEELFPTTGSEGKYSASFDGLTMAEDVAFEHKTLNEDLRAAMVDGCTGADLPKSYRVQMEQQCLVSGCEKVLFMASKWSGETLVEMRHCWYEPDAFLRAEIVRGWTQLEQDLAAYVPQDPEAPKPTGQAPETLPALRIEVTGQVTASNLAEFKETALTAIRGVNRELTTDQHFADAEQSIKWCEEVETRLAAAKEHALSQTTSIDQLFKTIDDISAEARKVRLELDKLVKARKDEIRQQIVVGAQKKLAEHRSALIQRLGGRVEVVVSADFAGVIKGKRSLTSIQDAVDTELARAKIAASELADRMEANIKALHGEDRDWGFLFPDLAAVAAKPAEDFSNLLAARISSHKQAEEQHRQRAEQAERERQEREAAAAAKAAQVVQQAAQAAAPQINAAVADAATTGTGILRMSAGSAKRIDPASVRNDTTIKLGDINARLAPISLNADGLASLGFEPVATEKNAKLYREADLRQIFLAISNHMLQLADEITA